MSQLAREARLKAREKAERLVRSSPGDIDASGWREPLGELGQVQTGPRVLSRESYRRGGKVAGHAGVAHYGRKPRASGGRTLADALINRDVKEANQKRPGAKHIGGMAFGGAAPDPSKQSQRMAESAMRMTSKLGTDPYNSQPAQASNYRKLWNMAGGRPGRSSGGGNWIAGAIKHPGALHRELHVPQGEKIPAKKLNAAADKGGKLGARARLAKTLKGMHHKSGGSVTDGTLEGTRPVGGRLARKGGGRTKKGMNVNIIIAPSPTQSRPMMPPPGGTPVPGGGPLGLHQGAPPPMAPPVAPPPAGASPPPMLPRKSGGRASHMLVKPGSYPLDHASGGGKGRLEKIKAYGGNR